MIWFFALSFLAQHRKLATTRCGFAQFPKRLPRRVRPTPGRCRAAVSVNPSGFVQLDRGGGGTWVRCCTIKTGIPKRVARAGGFH